MPVNPWLCRKILLLFYTMSLMNSKGLMEEYYEIYKMFSDFTMIPPDTYVRNLLIAEFMGHVEGAVVECGTWKGGMIAGIATLLKSDRNYYLFDSFEGLPPAQEIDGTAAIAWQQNTESSIYYNNCTAEESSAREAMTLSGVENYQIIKGWFNESLKNFDHNQKIAILRLDADWYESTMDCLEALYPSVTSGGVIILDDYYTWDGCCRAVHDFLSKYQLPHRIHQFDNDVCYLLKR
jgi:O-methyltransferase